MDGEQAKFARTIDSDSGVTTTVYDQLDRISSTTAAKNWTLSYTYDALRRETSSFNTITQTAANQFIRRTYDTVSGARDATLSRRRVCPRTVPPVADTSLVGAPRSAPSLVRWVIQRQAP